MTTKQREIAIETVKFVKAKKLFENDVKNYGSKSEALRALDCKSQEEAIDMLAAVQTVKVFKQNGKVIFQ